jgi:hypothetical protein
MTGTWQETTTGSNVQLCTVKYRRPEAMIDSTEGVVILLALKDGAGLKLYAHSSLRQQISDRDQEYIEDLLKDLTERVKAFPEDVFRQLASLSVGPIITDEVKWIEECQSAIEESYPDLCLCAD